MRQTLFSIVVLCAALLGATGPLAGGREARAAEPLPALTSEYLLDDRTAFYAGEYPEAFDVVSTLPEPPGDRLAVYAHEVFCWLEQHPAVRLGLVPFAPPLKIRFYRVTPEQYGAGPPPTVPPFFELAVSQCGREV
jgi:hypothetical protein